MHELAHILCDHTSDDDPFELEAKYLAAYLQAPKPLVIELGSTDCYLLSQVFDISISTAVYSLERAGARKRAGLKWREYEQRIIDCCWSWLDLQKALIAFGVYSHNRNGI